MKPAFWIPVVLFFLFPASVLLGHKGSQSHSEWSISKNEITAEISFTAYQATLLLQAYPASLPLTEVSLRHFVGNLVVMQQGQACVPQKVRPGTSDQSRVRFLLVFACPGEISRVEVENHAFFNLSAAHLHFARFIHPETKDVQEFVLTTRERSFSLNLAGNQERSLLESGSIFFRWGMEHILTGLDHLVFLIGLILVAAGRRELFLMIAAFTVGHTTSLALSALGLLESEGRGIELLIGFSILLVAGEALLRRNAHGSYLNTWGPIVLALIALGSFLYGGPIPLVAWAGLLLLWVGYFGLVSHGSPGLQTSMRFAFVCLFGTIHGLAFAGSISAALAAESRLALALVSFNVGLELAQLGVVVVWILGRVLLERFGGADRFGLISEVVPFFICGLGISWMVQRGIFA